MAVFRVRLLKPLEEQEVPVTKKSLVIGGGVAGIMAAKTLADQGYHTHLLEKEDRLGGQANKIYQTWQQEDVQTHLKSMIKSVEENKLIHIHLEVYS